MDLFGRIADGYGQLHHYLIVELADPRTENYYLISSPWPILCLLCAYVYFTKNLGPRLMKNVDPFDLKNTMIAYNIVQIILNIYLFKEALIEGWGGKFNWLCEPVNYSYEAIHETRICYLYFLTKIFDLLDTIFMVLKKRYSHISFLHVYHHAGMCALAWAAVKYLPGGHGTFVGFINAFVHAIMYSYYLITILRPHRHQIWWKKHLTQLQMVQFLLMALHQSLLFFQPNCQYPKFVPFVIIPQNTFMLLLFADFYRKAYNDKTKKE